MKALHLELDGNFTRGDLSYYIENEIINEASIQIPHSISQEDFSSMPLGYIYFQKSKEYPEVLELTDVFPLRHAQELKGKGLGSFIMSHTFMHIYNQSLNSQEISPETVLMVDTYRTKLISILEHRGFSEKGLGHMTTIQTAAEISEQIMHSRDWI